MRTSMIWYLIVGIKFFWDQKQYSLCKKLQSLKEVFKKLNDKHFAHISSWADFASKKIGIAQVELHDGPTNIQLK